MVNNKMIYGALLTLIGLVFSRLSFLYASMNPWYLDNMNGFVGALVGTNMWVLLFIGMVIMILRLVICFKEAYPDIKICHSKNV